MQSEPVSFAILVYCIKENSPRGKWRESRPELVHNVSISVIETTMR